MKKTKRKKVKVELNGHSKLLPLKKGMKVKVIRAEFPRATGREGIFRGYLEDGYQVEMELLIGILGEEKLQRATIWVESVELFKDEDETKTDPIPSA